MRVYVAKVEKNWKWSDRGAIALKSDRHMEYAAPAGYLG